MGNVSTYFFAIDISIICQAGMCSPISHNREDTDTQLIVLNFRYLNYHMLYTISMTLNLIGTFVGNMCSCPTTVSKYA